MSTIDFSNLSLPNAAESLAEQEFACPWSQVNDRWTITVRPNTHAEWAKLYSKHGGNREFALLQQKVIGRQADAGRRGRSKKKSMSFEETLEQMTAANGGEPVVGLMGSKDANLEALKGGIARYLLAAVKIDRDGKEIVVTEEADFLALMSNESIVHPNICPEYPNIKLGDAIAKFAMDCSALAEAFWTDWEDKVLADFLATWSGTLDTGRPSESWSARPSSEASELETVTTASSLGSQESARKETTGKPSTDPPSPSV